MESTKQSDHPLSKSRPVQEQTPSQQFVNLDRQEEILKNHKRSYGPERRRPTRRLLQRNAEIARAGAEQEIATSGKRDDLVVLY